MDILERGYRKLTEGTYPAKIDHSEDFEIIETKDGKVFGIKNMRLSAEDGTIKADISGDLGAARDYIELYKKTFVKFVKFIKNDNLSLFDISKLDSTKSFYYGDKQHV